MNMLSVTGISKSFNEFSLNDISIDLRKGEYFALLGPSGAGKSMLFNIIAGLLRQDKGTIFLEGKDITHMAPQKREIGLIFQNSALFPHLTVRKNIDYALRLQGFRSHELRSKVNVFAETFSIGHLLERAPSTLSGGEQQRIAIARSIAQNPKCLLLDEPLSSLDILLRDEIRALLKQINAEGLTMFHITHDYREAFFLADNIAIIDKGTLIRNDTVKNILKNPGSQFVAELTGHRNIFSYVTIDGFLVINGIKLFKAFPDKPGKGSIIIRDEAIAVAGEGQNGNALPARILDVHPLPGHTEVVFDIGIRLRKRISDSDVTRLSKGNIHLVIDQEKIIFF